MAYRCFIFDLLVNLFPADLDGHPSYANCQSFCPFYFRTTYRTEAGHRFNRCRGGWVTGNFYLSARASE